ncbi:hypothetical protein ACN2MM_07095 [Alkalilimnicola ehrlichii MLHE-1]|uniref:Lipoprotein n=1 Tax=Alkalilimnicola ehrlichii (strain ATCC BAA-1101 / DSM 17681 / MLHE-1) TaxID=187272 RepID=Q0A950_ALKEH|nr:hypothetical protein [Alkalilimnicola ehrlichii]ABI56637.1 hypothetical protein Mlg_1288 [Alkalilimnicola ehrlichii MLHE-1]
MMQRGTEQSRRSVPGRPLLLAGALVLSGGLLTACSGEVTYYEPGVYKGGEDELKESAEERAEALRERALQAHTDR